SHGEWKTPELQDTTCSQEKKETKAFTFYRMETKEMRKRYIAPCFVNVLEAYDGEIDLEQDKNLILNEFAIKLYLKHEDNIELGVILGRSFMRLTKGIVDFKNDDITIYPELDPFLDKPEETEKSEYDWELIPDGINFGDIPDIDKAKLPPFVCKIGKSARNKRKLFENHQINYFDEGPSLNIGKALTQEEATREEIAIDIYKRFFILEEARPVIETMAYNDKYKKILDSIFLDKQKLDGEIKKEEE
ncbi:hypothetical protein Tco_1023555, partial [Tanacetum coccineum]